MTDQRMQNAVAAAQEAFWTAIANHFPEINAGDFPPDAQLAFDDACISAGKLWVEGNNSNITDTPCAATADVEENPFYPFVDWQYEVNNGDTKLGYWSWVAHCIERDGGCLDHGMEE